MLEVYENARGGALFLFFEPTVWQHHEVLAMFRCEETSSASAVGKPAPNYWWLDEVEKEKEGKDGFAKSAVHLAESMKRLGPGIMLLQKPGKLQW